MQRIFYFLLSDLSVNAPKTIALEQGTFMAF
jgi:hypothetical protein